jgi:hypothetical protein
VKRIFYYSGYRLTVFHWQHNECIATYAFNPGDEGLDKFNTYLRATENTPVRILVDLIEEDFKKESIPHVGASDRKAIVSRIIDRQYRKNTDFATFRVVDREKTGRKDDVILYSVLSNPEILDPWLVPMDDAGIAISGIWSLPLLTPKLFNKLKIKTNNVLLVSQQVPSNLRQTFIKNGNFESSRSAVVNLDDASIGEYISTEVEQTIRFLSNQRHIGFDEMIEIHVMCRKADIEEIKSRCIDSNLRAFHYHELKALEDALNCNIQSAEYTNGIYSYVCANQIIPLGDYGNKATFVKYYEQLSSKALYALSVTLLLAATILSFSFVSESIVQDEEAITLRKQAEVINNNYQKKLASMEPRLKQAESMQSSVLLADNIKSNHTVSPLNFMTFISRIIARTGMRDMEITALSWKQNQSLTIPVKNTRKVVKETIDYGKQLPINQIASISGYIPVSKYGLKDSVNKVSLLAKRLEDHKLIIKTNIKRMPVDTRPESSINLEVQTSEKLNNSTDKQNGQFEIELLVLGNQS